jgi:uncharacterized protein YndB with AHSA1/START domain
MVKRSTVHDTFVINRNFPFARQAVFAAWSSTEAKSKWFVGPGGWELRQREMDFRVGGHERVVGRHTNGKITSFDALYYEIVPNERIVYAYEMHQEDVKISISLATVEFQARKEGTQLIITEQGVFLDEFDDARGREHGTQILIGQLEQALKLYAAAWER